MKRTVFFVSDGTGITAETLGHSLLAQFENVEFEESTLPYIDTVEKAEAVAKEINRVANQEGTANRPIISTPSSTKISVTLSRVPMAL